MINNFFRKNSIILILILCIANSFLISPPNLNYGDQALVNLHINNKFIEFLKNDTDKSFKEFYNTKYNSFFSKKLEIDNHESIYGISKNNRYIVDEEEVKTLTRSLEILISSIFLHKIEMEKIFVITNLIILILTIFFAYLVGSQIFSKKYGLILSILIASNIYFNQLIRSNAEQQTLIYPLIFLIGIFLLKKIYLKRNYLYYFAFSFCLSLCWLNGYPNTTLVLFPFLIIMIFLIPLLNKYFIKNENFYFLRLDDYFLIFIVFIFSTLILLIFWSYIHNYNLLNHIEILNNRFDRIFNGEIANASFLSNFNVLDIFNHFKNLSTIIFSNTDIYYAPHEPQFLFKLSYINLIEGVFFILGILFFFRYFSFSNYSYLLLFFILSLFFFRSLSDRLWLVEKLNYDYLFLIHFFSAMGIYFFDKENYFSKLLNLEIFKKIVVLIKNIYFKIYFFLTIKKNVQINNNSNFELKNIYIYIISLIFLINTFNFNYYFINKFNENLGQHNGIYQIKNFINDNLKTSEDLLVLDWHWGDIYYPALITDLKGIYNWDVLSMHKDIFFNINYENYYKNYENIFIISPANFTNISLKTKLTGGRKVFNNDLNQFFAYGNFYKKIYDRNDRPVFNIHKLSKNLIHTYVKIEDNKNYKTRINLDNNEKLSYIDLSSNVLNIEIKCEKETILFDFSNSNYDFFNLNFDKNSYAEIYNDFSNQNYKINNKSKNLIFYNSNDNNTTYISSSKGISFVDYNYNFPLNISSIQLSTPYLIFNNQNKSNFIKINVINNKEKINLLIDKIRSDGSNKFGNWRQTPIFDILEFEGYGKANYINFISKKISIKNKIKNFIVKYTVGSSKFDTQKWSSRFLSNNNLNSALIMNSALVDLNIEDKTKNLINSCKKIELNIDFLNKTNNDFSYAIINKNNL